jgi:MFS transporter, SP family, sugar:H+ symporter
MLIAPYLVNTGPGNAGLGVKVFFIWGSTCACCFIFAYLCIPETKGLSLEQVDILYQNTTPVRSISYRKRLLAEDVHASDVKAIHDHEKAGAHESYEHSEKV